MQLDTALHSRDCLPAPTQGLTSQVIFSLTNFFKFIIKWNLDNIVKNNDQNIMAGSADSNGGRLNCFNKPRAGPSGKPGNTE
jgi:hypothetical protein